MKFNLYEGVSWILLIIAAILAINKEPLESITLAGLSSLGFFILAHLQNIQEQIENLKGGKRK